MSREADLNQHLSNPDDNESKKDDNESKKDESANSEEPKNDEKQKTSTKADDGGEALKNFKPVEFGTADDKQFQEALNILKGIDIYKKIN